MNKEQCFIEKKCNTLIIISIACLLLSFWDRGLLFPIVAIILSYFALKYSKREKYFELPLIMFYLSCTQLLFVFISINTELDSKWDSLISFAIALVPLLVLFLLNVKYVEYNNSKKINKKLTWEKFLENKKEEKSEESFLSDIGSFLFGVLCFIVYIAFSLAILYFTIKLIKHIWEIV